MLDVGSPGEYLSDDGILAVFIPFAFTPVLEADDERTARAALSAAHHVVTGYG